MMAMVVCTNFAQASEQLDRVYFDEQFTSLQRSVAEVKGNTSQIVEILGNVFEGTVPRGGTLIQLCNQNGWNLVVLMGHNGISDPNKVAAGAKFEYPRTAEEFQLALEKGQPLYREWLKNQKTTFRVDRIQADAVDLNRLNVKMMNITEKLNIKEMEVDKLKVRLAEITEELRIKQLKIQKLNIDRANLRQVNIDQLRIKQLEIDNLKQLCEQMRKRCAELEARHPKVVERKVVVYRDATGEEVAQGTCKDVPWPATYAWANFPEGAIGTETQLRLEMNPIGYKFKLVTRKGKYIYALKCFKSNQMYNLTALGQRWGHDFVPYKTFGNTGDGGRFATLVIGIAK